MEIITIGDIPIFTGQDKSIEQLTDGPKGLIVKKWKKGTTPIEPAKQIGGNQATIYYNLH